MICRSAPSVRIGLKTRCAPRICKQRTTGSRSAVKSRKACEPFLMRPADDQVPLATLAVIRAHVKSGDGLTAHETSATGREAKEKTRVARLLRVFVPSWL